MATIDPAKHRLKDGTALIVRNAVGQDAEEILYLAQSNFSTSQFTLTEPHEFKMTVEQERAWIEGMLGPKSKLLLVALVDDLFVGMLDFQVGYRRKISHCGIIGMAVRDGWRGKGVGKALLAEVIRWATAHPEIERIELGVLEPNEDAKALYTKMGFKEEGRKIRGVRFQDGTYADEIQMCRFVK